MQKLLAQAIQKYYQENFNKLTNFHAYHYCSRLYLWNNDPFSKKWLEKISHQMDSTKTNKEKASILLPYHDGGFQINYQDLRQPLLIQYPVRKITHVLFSLLFAEKIHQTDLSSKCLINKQFLNDVNYIKKTLINDVDSLIILSTFAINFYTLISTVDSKSYLNESIFQLYSVGIKQRNWNNGDGWLARKIYYFTHLIIGATLFYTVKPDQELLPILFNCLSYIEQMITHNYKELYLDIKNEFLLCLRILNANSPLENIVMSEIVRSVSPSGQYLIDKYSNGQLHKTDLSGSEHRNVLFIMQSMPWKLCDN